MVAPTGFRGKSESADDEDGQAYSAWLQAQDVETVVDEAVDGWSYLTTCLALHELARRAPQRALPLVAQHLRERSMYQECAFDCLYAIDRAAALAFVHAHAASADIDLFGAMLGAVSGDVGLLPEAAELLPAARCLLGLLRERRTEIAEREGRLLDMEVELFLDAFGDLN